MNIKEENIFTLSICILVTTTTEDITILDHTMEDILDTHITKNLMDITDFIILIEIMPNIQDKAVDGIDTMEIII